MSLEVRNLSFSYPGGRQILSGCSFTLTPGKITVLLGKNGSGKSTLGKLLAGLYPPSEGQILLNGQNLSLLPPRQRAAMIGVVSQIAPPVFDFTAEEIVLMGCHPRLGRLAAPGKGILNKVRKAMDQLEVLPLKDRIFQTLSGGEQQRIRLAAALALESPWLLLDEPTSAQDPAGTHLIMEQLNSLPWHPGILIITHDLTLTACRADQILLLRNRSVLAGAAPDQIFTRNNLESLYGCPMKFWGRTERGLSLFLPAEQKNPRTGNRTEKHP